MTKSSVEEMLASATRDEPIAIKDWKPQRNLLDGMEIRDLNTLIDRRGSVFEMYDERWGFHEDPLCFAYCFTVRPGFVKGWGLHEDHEDRYCLIRGEIDLVLYDPREDSSTYKQICRIQMSEYHRCLVSIPRFVWHADHNIGSEEAVVVNFPTIPYQHGKPDKHRLPVDTPLIPYDFGKVSGG